jgi:hypothetical protein
MLARSNPEIAGAVADEAWKAALRVPSADDPSRIVVPSDQREPRDLSSVTGFATAF